MLRVVMFMAIGQTAASFIPNIFPNPTPSVDTDLGVYGWSPKPTNALFQPPSELRKRAVDTCGYVSGNALQSLTCSVGQICVVNTILQAAGCCIDLSCNLFTACLPKVLVSPGSIYNSRTGLCTQGSFTSCQTQAYDYGAAGTLSAYACGPTSAYTVVLTTSTAPLVPPPPVTTPIITTAIITQGGTTVISVATSTFTAVASSVASSAAASQSAPPVVHTQIVTVAASSGATAGGAAGGAPTSGSITVVNPTANAAAASTSPAKPFPVGAAVGGAIGGLAIIGAAIAGIIFLFLRHKRKENANAGARGVDNTSEYTGPGAGPGPAVQQAYYPPPPPAGVAYQPPQGYPQPPPQIYQQGPQGPYPQHNPAEAAAYAQQNNPNKGFNQPETQSFSPPGSPAPPYPPSPYQSSPPLGGAVEIDPGRPARRSELY